MVLPARLRAGTYQCELQLLRVDQIQSAVTVPVAVGRCQPRDVPGFAGVLMKIA
jgi:hypothetical protein